MKSRFITGFWGSSDPGYWKGRTLAGREQELADRWQTKTLPEAIASLPLMRELNAMVYAIGEEANEQLSSRCSTVKFEQRPGAHWRNKLDCIAHALQTYDEVVWIDLDASLLAPLPYDFWEALRTRAPIQARIRQYHRRKCHHWRSENPRTLCSAAFIYCRDASIIEKAIEWLEDLESWLKPQDAICLTEEHAIAWVIDQLQDGWKGHAAYHAEYDPPWYTIGSEIFPCETPIFTAR